MGSVRRLSKRTKREQQEQWSNYTQPFVPMPGTEKVEAAGGCSLPPGVRSWLKEPPQGQ